MDKIVLAVADDEVGIHELFQTSVNELQEEVALDCEIVDFYNTDDLLEYSYENFGYIDALFLDIDFGRGNPRGTDALPDIREICPDIDICMLTGMRLDTKDVLGYTSTYGVEFIDKPVRSAVLSSKIAKIKSQLAAFEELKAMIKQLEDKIDENECCLEMAQDEIRDTKNALLEQGQQMAEYMEKLNKEVKTAAEKNKDLRTFMETVQTMFDNLDFNPLAIVEIFDKKTFDKRVFKLLMTLNNNEQLSTGVKKQKFVEWKIDKLYEYRYSQTGRLYVQELGGGRKPLIYCVDYNHKKHKG